MTWRRGLGVSLIVGGAALALLLPDVELFWFQGRPLGILLVVLGVVELADGARRRRGERRPGLLHELGDDLGLTGADDREPPRRRSSPASEHDGADGVDGAAQPSERADD